MIGIFKARALSVNALLAAACGAGLFLYPGIGAATMLEEPASPAVPVEQADETTTPKSPSTEAPASPAAESSTPAAPKPEADDAPALEPEMPAEAPVRPDPEQTDRPTPAEEPDQALTTDPAGQEDAASETAPSAEPAAAPVADDPAPAAEAPDSSPSEAAPESDQSASDAEGDTGEDPVEKARRLRLGLDGPPDVAKALEILHEASIRGNSWAMLALAELYRTGEGVPADPAKAEGLYHRTREGADPEAAKLAAYGLGQLYSSGPLRNPPMAVEHYRRSVEAGNPWGMYALGEIYRTGDGVPAVPQEAEILYKSAMEADDPEAARAAAYGLGELYSKGPLRDPVKAAEAYTIASEAGHPWATYALAERYREGLGIEADARKAEDLLLRAIDSGDPALAKAATYTLGSLYDADGPLPDPAKAMRYYDKAAEAGNAWAMLALAEIYGKGIGVPVSEDRMRQYYASAMEAGDPEVAELATHAIKASEPAAAEKSAETPSADAPGADAEEETEEPAAQVAAISPGADADSETSAESKPEEPASAADPTGEKPAMHRASARERVHIWETYRKAERFRKGANPRKAAELYKEILSFRDPNSTRAAAYRLAKLYSKGPLRDPAAAARYFQSAVENGSSWAAYSLAGLYRNGVGVEQDRKKARALYLKAARSKDGRAARAARQALARMGR